MAREAPTSTSLDDLERLYLDVGTANYAWYRVNIQGRAQALAPGFQTWARPLTEGKPR
jgi:hypothetical protein